MYNYNIYFNKCCYTIIDQILITYLFCIGKILLKNPQNYIYLHSIHNPPPEKDKHCTLCRIDNSYFVLTFVEYYITYIYNILLYRIFMYN